jgi:hypothetical protein
MPSLTITLPKDIVDAARERAKSDHRTLNGYIEHLIKVDLAGPDGVVVTVTAPDNIREYIPVRSDNDTDELFNQRNAVMDALLTAAGR